MAGNSTQPGRTVTSKIISILLAFGEGREHSLTDIARRARLPVSTAHRLAADLTSWQLLERTDDGRYRVGLPLRIIGAADPAPPSVAERGPSVLSDLAAATKCRARLGVLSGIDLTYIEKLPEPRPVSSFSPSATLPTHATALGRALLAFSPSGQVESTIIRGLRPYTPYTVTSADRFRRSLAVTRLTKVAVTREELERGVCGVAMPVFGARGSVVAAIELSIRDLGRHLQAVVPSLAIATRSLSRELGASPCATPVSPEAVGG